MPAPGPEWFLPAFFALWIAICGVLSAMGGWRELAERFRSDAPVEGQTFRFGSGSIGSGIFPVNYRNCLFVTIGPQSFSLSVFFLFRFLHPRLVIPWSAVERCEPIRFWFTNPVAVHLAGFSRRILFSGSLGRKVYETWIHERKAS